MSRVTGYWRIGGWGFWKGTCQPKKSRVWWGEFPSGTPKVFKAQLLKFPQALSSPLFTRIGDRDIPIRMSIPNYKIAPSNSIMLEIMLCKGIISQRRNQYISCKWNIQVYITWFKALLSPSTSPVANVNLLTILKMDFESGVLEVGSSEPRMFWFEGAWYCFDITYLVRGL